MGIDPISVVHKVNGILLGQFHQVTVQQWSTTVILVLYKFGNVELLEYSGHMVNDFQTLATK